jgi:hypothetical protein
MYELVSPPTLKAKFMNSSLLCRQKRLKDLKGWKQKNQS